MLRNSLKIIDSLIVYIALAVIKLYQLFLSPIMGHNCRFYPTCSHYSTDVFKLYGSITGFVLTVLRLSKCQPLHSGGVDSPEDGWRYLPKWWAKMINQTHNSKT